MTPEHWQKIKSIVENALQQPEQQRTDFIDKACGEDLELKKEVTSLIHFHGEVGEFLEKPVIPINAANNNFKPITPKLNSGSLLQDRYLIIEQIGQGGMGAVYKAQDKRLNKVVALKQTIVTSERLHKAFEQEAQLLAKLRHPALPTVIDHFHENNGQFLVMEFVVGETFSQLLSKQSKAFKQTQVIAWAKQLLEVLDYLHSQNPPVIHRDIKPNNLKLTESDKIALLDFGLAKGFAESKSLTVESSIAGYTPYYAPLEQINGVGTDPRSDFYSFAATFYTLLTGDKPPDATFRAATILNGESDPLQINHLVNIGVEPDFAQLLIDCLSQNINQRPTSAKAILNRLNNLSALTVNSVVTTQIKSVDQEQVKTLLANNSVITTPIKTVPASSTKRKSYYVILSVLVVTLILLILQANVSLSPKSSVNNVVETEQKTNNTQLVNKPKVSKKLGEPGFKADLISVDIKEVKLYDLLKFFSDNYGLNFIVDKSVPKMIVTMKVNDVPWDEALYSVLETNQLAYKIENSLMSIYPKSKLEVSINPNSKEKINKKERLKK